MVDRDIFSAILDVDDQVLHLDLVTADELVVPLRQVVDLVIADAGRRTAEREQKAAA